MLLAHFQLDKEIFHFIERWGCPGLFAILIMCGLGLPLPEDIPLIAAGAFIQQGKLNLAAAAFCAWAGIIGGDCILYSLGRAFGNDVTKIPIIGRHVNVKRMETVHVWFERYGVWVVAVGRLVAGVRGAMVVVAGATRFKFWKFILADSLAAIVSGGLFLFLGYKFSQHLHHILHDVLPHIKLAIFAVVLLAAAGFTAYYFWKRSRRPADVEPPPPTPATTSV